MKLSFHGADRGVTGSCHLVECAGRKILIDCGLFQGNRELEEDNAEPFGFDAAAIDFVLLTHAHLDHCGRLPLLVKRGFNGEIITTAASRELARLVLLDAANLQEEDSRRRWRKATRRGGRKADAEPLYSVVDALGTFDAFGRNAEYGKPLDLAAGIRATFIDAGHILGSACLFLELEEDGHRRTVLFSGDIGNSGKPILRDPTPPPRSDVVVMETTYGDRLHKPLPPSVAELYDAVGDAFRRGGNVIIPTFALERAQELLYYLREGTEKGALTRSIQVFLNSPMAISATEIFRRHPECFDQEAMALFREGRDPFGLPGLHFTRESAELDGAEQNHRRRHHHGRFGDGDRRAGAPSPEAQSLAPRRERHLRRLRGQGHARPSDHRRGERGEHFRRANPGQSPYPHDQRLLRPRRSGGAHRLA